jgi:inner membrane protein
MDCGRNHKKQLTMDSLTSVTSSIFDKGRLFLKAVFIFIMALVLLIPSVLMRNLVYERESRQKEAIADITSKWAGKQTVLGPLLVVPFNEYSRDVKNNPVVIRKNAYFLPANLQTSCIVTPERRYRGIYQVAVYHAEITMAGRFQPLKFQQLKVQPENFLWSEAALLFRVSDIQQGINEDLSIQWAGQTLPMTAQVPGFTPFKEAFTAPVLLDSNNILQPHDFSLHLSLNGSEQLLFATAALENKITMQSTWPDPSFTGVKLPDTRQVKDSGFLANWKFMNRAIPPVSVNGEESLEQASLGADLVIPVDSYDKTIRAVKYAILCIVLTFASFFLIETIYKRPLHLLHYGLAGLALVLFYILLLSISEYSSFNTAYAVAGTATIALVAWFIGSILKSGRLSVFIAFVLAVVYGYIFCIIQLQDYALLMGSIGLFIALAIIMYFSRKLSW